VAKVKTNLEKETTCLKAFRECSVTSWCQELSHTRGYIRDYTVQALSKSGKGFSRMVTRTSQLLIFLLKSQRHLRFNICLKITLSDARTNHLCPISREVKRDKKINCVIDMLSQLNHQYKTNARTE